MNMGLSFDRFFQLFSLPFLFVDIRDDAEDDGEKVLSDDVLDADDETPGVEDDADDLFGPQGDDDEISMDTNSKGGYEE